MWTSFEYALAAVAAAVIAANVVAGYFALRRYRQGRLRREFRSIISRKIGDVDPSAAERSLANVVAEASHGHLTELHDLAIDSYIIDYILDINFKPRYYSLLLDRLSYDRSLQTVSADEILSTIDGWRNMNPTYATLIEKMISDEATVKGSARRVQEYIESRENYYGAKQNLFVDEVIDATRKAIDGARKTYAGA